MSRHRNQEILEKIANEEYYVTENVMGASVVWRKFLLIKDHETNERSGFVQCKFCKKNLQYKNRSGTSSLTRHSCKNNEEPLTPDVAVATEDRKDILEGCITYCAQDRRSFNSIGGPGFQKLAQKLINVGFKYGRIPVQNILPHATTVSRNILEQAEQVKNDILPEIVAAIRQGVCAATTDFWTDQYTKTSYYTVTVHYINESWKLIARVLFITDFPEERKTGDNIKRELYRKFETFGIPSHIIKNITFVTDQGSNIIKALETVERLNCSAHSINSALRNAFKEKCLSEHAPNTLHILQTTKSIVGYLKRSGLVSHLPQTVHQETETR